MTRSFRRNAVLFCLSFGFVFASVSNALAAKAPVTAFGQLPSHAGLEISPDGRYLAALRENGGRYVVIIYDLMDLNKKAYAVGSEKADATWVEWASANRLLVSLRFPARRFGTPTTETRLVAVNADGSNMKEMVKQRRNEIIIQIKNRVVDFLSNDPNHILMAYNGDNPAKPRVYSVDVNTGRGSMVQSSRTNIQGWLSDQQGRVRIAFGFDKGLEFVEARSAGAEDWRRIWQADMLGTIVFDPLLFKADGNKMYVLSNHEGGTSGIYEFDLAQQKFTKKVFKHDRYDTSGLVLNSARTKVLGVSYLSTGGNVHWLDSTAERMDDQIEEALGVGATIINRTRDNNKAVVYAGSSTDPGKYYIFDVKKRNLNLLTSRYPGLDQVKLSRPISFNYEARDGLEIQGFLTLPTTVDTDNIEPLPTVILPHGGPGVRDAVSFDYEVQFLANRGYAVFQMNFRGSSGYGAEFQQAGYGEWGQAMQNDVTDGTRFLIDQSIADPDRVCIYGGSYGGYAALMGPIREPGLYSCAVSLNGVTDLRAMMRFDRQYIGGKYANEAIGDYSDDRAELRAYSPKLRADEMAVPVLLAHGTDDRTVPFNQSQAMASALSRAGKEHKFVKLEDGDHSLSSGEHRVTFLRELESFLAANLQ